MGQISRMNIDNQELVELARDDGSRMIVLDTNKGYKPMLKYRDTLLEKFKYHFTLSHFNDYTNLNFVNFVKDYRENFKTEPDRIYAALGYDIAMFFVNSLMKNGEDFIHNPNLSRVDNIIGNFYFERKDENFGYQNKKTTIYKMEDYKIRAVIE